MSQLFGRGKPNKADETIQRTKEKIIDLTKSLSDRQRYLKQLIGMNIKQTDFFFFEKNLFFSPSRSIIY
jgi:hypothetical protein